MEYCLSFSSLSEGFIKNVWCFKNSVFNRSTLGGLIKPCLRMTSWMTELEQSISKFSSVCSFTKCSLFFPASFFSKFSKFFFSLFHFPKRNNCFSRIRPFPLFVFSSLKFKIKPKIALPTLTEINVKQCDIKYKG